MKKPEDLKPNRLVANMIDKLQIRCVRSSDIDDDGGDGPPAKKIKIGEGGAAAAAAAPQSDGCDWVGAIRDLDNHAAQCPFAEVTCAHDTCDVVVSRRDMAAHAAACAHRRVPCAQCNGNIRMNEMAIHTEEKCSQRSVVCPNEGCGVLMPAISLRSHKRECGHRLIKCGTCDVGYKHQDGQAEHDRVSMQSHLSVAMIAIAGLTERVNSQSTRIRDLERGGLERGGQAGLPRINLALDDFAPASDSDSEDVEMRAIARTIVIILRFPPHIHRQSQRVRVNMDTTWSRVFDACAGMLGGGNPPYRLQSSEGITLRGAGTPEDEGFEGGESIDLVYL
jgi:hypothetical protein